MFVRTQFETIVNLTEFDKIKIEWYKRQESGSVFHTISVVSEEYSQRLTPERHIEVSSEGPMRTYKSETLAQFRQEMKGEAQAAYQDLYNALKSGNTTFDIGQYTSCN